MCVLYTCRRVVTFFLPSLPSFSIDMLREMSASDIGSIVRVPAAGRAIADAVHSIPLLELEYHLQPITRGVLKVCLKVYPAFKWNDRLHGTSEPWWIWVEDNESTRIYHHEFLLLQVGGVAVTFACAWGLVGGRWGSVGGLTAHCVSFFLLLFPTETARASGGAVGAQLHHPGV